MIAAKRAVSQHSKMGQNFTKTWKLWPVAWSSDNATKISVQWLESTKTAIMCSIFRLDTIQTVFQKPKTWGNFDFIWYWVLEIDE